MLLSLRAADPDAVIRATLWLAALALEIGERGEFLPPDDTLFAYFAIYPPPAKA